MKIGVGSQRADELPKLLIIDDSDDFVEIISNIFSNEYSCIKSLDGQDGISCALEINPDIILCDVRMPKITGLEVVRVLKNNPQTHFIPIILLTGYNNRQSRLEGLRALADDFLSKPLDYEELRIKMANLLTIRQEIINNEQIDLLQKDLDLESYNYSQIDRQWIEALNDYLRDHFSDKNLNVQLIAEAMNMSARQLQRRLKFITNLSPMDLLRIFRLRQSTERLLRHKSIAEVSEACGFKSPNYFCSCFKAYFQVTPSGFQKNPDKAI